MDVLADVLSATRLGTTVVAQAELVPPWGLEIDPIAEAHLHVVLRGCCWLRIAGEPRPVRLGAGDAARGLPDFGRVLAGLSQEPRLCARAVSRLGARPAKTPRAPDSRLAAG